MPECVQGGAHSSHIKTSDLYWTYNLPKRFDNPNWFSGYGVQVECQNPMYRRTSQDYGWLPPSIHTVPVIYRPQDASFSNTYAQFGMYRNYSLNATPNPNSTIPWTKGAAAKRCNSSPTLLSVYKRAGW
ncbi:UPF0691 protein C9orf116-like protein [Frankliniella fusca]|uniref:UPF0691 protein C9orf116-like protein n=1 Tax=Frankliniella fusca TaxID=407009 RepID=A0AAE1LHG4_9NEOP|nr:UPF0691 protein C9orf116-like protein [Frankliniella fusca]